MIAWIRNEFDRWLIDQMIKSYFHAVKANTADPVADAELMDWMVRDRKYALPSVRNANQALNHAIKMNKLNYLNEWSINFLRALALDNDPTVKWNSNTFTNIAYFFTTTKFKTVIFIAEHQTSNPCNFCAQPMIYNDYC